MLTEQLLASISAPRPNQKTNTAIARDAAIFQYELQPHATQRGLFKKSATAHNCLAVTATHIFAAQADRAIVAVYSREKGNQEAIIPFKERVTSIALACADTLLVLGTEEGRLFLWETLTGRIISTSQAHLQAATAVAVDPTSNFILSGSLDASIHVWSLPALTSFTPPPASAAESQNSPIHTLSGHRDAVTDIVMGHGSSSFNIAVSASKDGSCVVWDYHSNTVLRTILLPFAPLCLALDPADRALYCGYGDGSVHFVDFYSENIGESGAAQESLHNYGNAAMPMQPDARQRWEPPTSDIEATLSLGISYDGTKLITGHESGKIVVWDIPTGRFLSQLATPPLPGAVNNLVMLPVSGFSDTRQPNIKAHAIIKPRFGEYDNTDSRVPAKYNLAVQQVGSIPTPNLSATATTSTISNYESALTHSIFPDDMLAACIADIESHSTSDSTSANTNAATQPDFLSLSAAAASSSTPSDALTQQNERLTSEVARLRRLQKTAFEQIEKLSGEKQQLMMQVRQGAQTDVDTEMKDLETAERGWRELGRGSRAKGSRS